MTLSKFKEFWDTVPKGNIPKDLGNVSYLVLMGSRGYGTHSKTSDYDYYGFMTPPLEGIFPYLKGDIPNFGRQKQGLNHLELQKIKNEDDELADVFLYSIARYFHLCMMGNPNMIDSLFIPNDSILYMDIAGIRLRNNRFLFLSQKIYHTFRGMAHSHLNRLRKNYKDKIVPDGKRGELVRKYGYDTKDAGHVIRVLSNLNNFLRYGDSYMDKTSWVTKEIINGNLPFDEFNNVADKLFSKSEQLIKDTELPLNIRQDEIKKVLINCIEDTYGRLSSYGFGIRGE